MRASQSALNRQRYRVRATEHAPRGPFHVLERRHGLAEIVDYAVVLYSDDCATLDDLREAVETLEETAPTARRVFGSAHPLVEGMEKSLQNARQLLILRGVAAMSPPTGSV